MDIRKEICQIGKKLEEKGFVAGTDGNISCKIAADRILITPSGIPKGELTVDEIITINIRGEVQAGRGKASSETLMHVAVYAKRPDVQAIVHAHPPTVTALTIAGVDLAQCIIPEIVINFGRIPTAEYATPCTAEGAFVVDKLIDETDIIVLDRHGSLTVGNTLRSAYYKLEKLEHAALVTAQARMLGKIKILSNEEVKKLVALREKLGIKTRANPCENCTACDRTGKKETISHELIADIVTEELLKRIAK